MLPTTSSRAVTTALGVLAEAGKLQALAYDVDSALEVLVDNAIKEFGPAPYDVYNCIFNFSQTKSDHAQVLEDFAYPRLVDLIKAFYNDFQLDSRMISVHPHPFTDERDAWEINFKSILIGNAAMERMRVKEDEHLREKYETLRKTPQSSALAGWFFEALAHRLVFQGWRGPNPLPMASDNCNPSTFSITLARPADNTPWPSLTPPDGARIVEIDLTKHFAFTESYYYKLKAINNPLFDSFTVKQNYANNTILISLFKMTISPEHKGSAKGYDLVRNIRTFVYESLGSAGPYFRIKVAYFLVCPGVESRYRWTMPIGWKENAGVHGNVFCIPIPVAVRRVYSLPILRLS